MLTEQMIEQGQTELVGLLHVAAAMVLGGLIGLEREHANRPAGFRTHTIVAGAATLLVLLAKSLVVIFSAETYGEMIRTDPIRVVEAIITGVAFLGAGTIFRDRGESAISGLTTAASLMLSAGVGVAIGLERYVLAVGTTLLALFALRSLMAISNRVGENGERG